MRNAIFDPVAPDCAQIFNFSEPRKGPSRSRENPDSQNFWIHTTTPYDGVAHA